MKHMAIVAALMLAATPAFAGGALGGVIGSKAAAALVSRNVVTGTAPSTKGRQPSVGTSGSSISRSFAAR